MRIGVVGVPYFTGGREATQGLVTFLRKSQHEVSLFDYYYLGPHTRRQQFVRRSLGWSRGLRYREHIIAKNLTTIVEGIRSAHCDVVIAVENGDVLLWDLGAARKIFYANAPTSPEVYASLRRARGAFNWGTYEDACKKELACYEASEIVIFCWNTHVEFVKQYIYAGKNVLLHPGLGWFGCRPSSQRCAYAYPPFIAYMGLTKASWNNSELLGKLASELPYAIHCYGLEPPHESSLNYQGFSNSTDILCKYQFGLHTATTDRARRFGFASKIMTYLSYGLPVLSPSWQLVSDQLRGVLAYDETTIESLIERAAEPDSWAELADTAYDQARELDWDRVLQPLMRVL